MGGGTAIHPALAQTTFLQQVSQGPFTWSGFSVHALISPEKTFP